MATSLEDSRNQKESTQEETGQKEERVEPISGELFRYYVKSWNTQARYLVDLAEADFQGTCSCIHFSVRVHPARVNGRKMECKHITAAIRFAWPLFARQFMKEYNRRGIR